MPAYPYEAVHLVRKNFVSDRVDKGNQSTDYHHDLTIFGLACVPDSEVDALTAK